MMNIYRIRDIRNIGKQAVQLVFLLSNAIAIVSCGASQSVNSAASISETECSRDKSFAYVPGGEFIQGSDRQERDFAYRISAESIADTDAEIEQLEQKLRKTGWFDNEADRKTSSVSGFCISRNLVTNREYQEFIQATNHRTPGISQKDYRKQGFLVHSYTKVQDFLWDRQTYPADTAQHPVVLISYSDALAYADWKGETTGATYRLPTAIEWEKAARGKNGEYFPWGSDWQNGATNDVTSGLKYTSNIGKFPLSKSVYGMEDMSGNVFEYTSTLKFAGQRVTMKGCSWDDLSGFCRGAYEHTRPVDSRHILFGFRLVKE